MQGQEHLTPVKTATIKQPRASITTSEDESIITSPSVKYSHSSKLSLRTECPTSVSEDSNDFVFICEQTDIRKELCSNFHVKGYCLFGSQCQYQHQQRDAKQIQKEMRSSNPIHILNEYPELMCYRSSIVLSTSERVKMDD